MESKGVVDVGFEFECRVRMYQVHRRTGEDHLALILDHEHQLSSTINNSKGDNREIQRRGHEFEKMNTKRIEIQANR